MNSIFDHSEKLNLLIGFSFSVSLVFFVTLLILISKHKKAKEMMNETVELLKTGLSNKQSVIEKSEILNLSLRSEIGKLERQFHNLELSYTESKATNDVLRNENKKLLTQVADDVTINIKSSNATVPVTTQKKSRPYKKKKNVGSTASNLKVGKAK